MGGALPIHPSKAIKPPPPLPWKLKILKSTENYEETPNARVYRLSVKQLVMFEISGVDSDLLGVCVKSLGDKKGEGRPSQFQFKGGC